jgi:hypothetical protein
MTVIDQRAGAVNRPRTPEAPPSPLNGERAGVRGENLRRLPDVSSASVISLVWSAANYQDVQPATANPPKSYRARTGRLSVASSKIVGSECCAISSNRRALGLSLGAPENRAALRPTQGCSAPQRKRNRGNDRRHCAGAGTCMRRSVDPGESPRVFSRPKWIFSAEPGRVNWDSSPLDLTENQLQFKRHLVISPLTLTLSPLRGEGIRGGSRSKLRSIKCRRSTPILQL